MKTITLPRLPPHTDQLGGRCFEWPVHVDWFPPLTDEQILENGIAIAWGLKPPHEDPNLITVRLER